MATNTSFQKFPKDGTMELAVEKLVDGIINNKFNEDEIDFLSTEFRYNFPQKEKYGKVTKLSLDNFSKETIENGIKEGLSKDHDLFLDMKYAGRLAPYSRMFYNSNMDVEEYAENKFKDISTGEDFPSALGITLDDDVQIFYHKLLGNKLYNSEKYKSLRDADEDIDLATQEYFTIANAEENSIKEQLYADFEAKLKEIIENDDYLYEDLSEINLEDAEESFKSEGFLETDETYLILASDINWKHDSGCKLVDISNFNGMINAISPDCDCMIEIKSKLGAPYFEARVSSHDVPMGSYMYLLPESQWDKAEEYSFLQNAIKNNSFVKEIFHNRKMKREMEKESKNNPIVKKLLKKYEQEIYEYGMTTAEVYNKGVPEDSWYNVGKYLAKNIVQGTQVSPKDFKKCEELLIKFNPTLTYSPEEITKDLKKHCQQVIEYNKKYAEKNNQR